MKSKRNKAQPHSDPLTRLDEVTGTLTQERQFFDALFAYQPAAITVNRIIHLTTVYGLAAKSIPEFLTTRAGELFTEKPSQVGATLCHVLADIDRAVRLAAYLCLKGIPHQALAVLRGALEQVGVYTHVWHLPEKHAAVLDPDSDEYARAFRYLPKSMKKEIEELKAKKLSYRFKYCGTGSQLTSMHKLLSGLFVHSITPVAPSTADLSCEFVDRASPKDLEQHFGLAQQLSSLILLEIVTCIPKDYWDAEEITALLFAWSLLAPTLGTPCSQQP